MFRKLVSSERLKRYAGLLALILNKLARQSSTRVVGHVDAVREGVVHGWAWFPGCPIERPLLDIFVDGCFEGQTRACIRRDDLLAAGIGDGCYGFELCLRPNVEGKVFTARVIRKGRPELISFTSTAYEDSLPCNTAEDYLRTTFYQLALNVAITRGTELARKRIDTTSTKVYNRLFETSPAPSEPLIYGRSLCAYLDYIRRKWDAENKFLVGDAIQEYESFLKFYLGAHAKAQRPWRAPLSQREIHFLNEGPDKESPFLESQCERLFKTNFALGPREPAPDASFSRAYSWAIYQSRTLHVEDCLVAPALQAELRSCGDDAGLFPLSRFMERFISDNVFLKQIDTTELEGRLLVYFSVLLFALRAPNLCLYVPTRWLSAFLDNNHSDGALFDRYMASVIPGAKLNSTHWRGLLREANFDVDVVEFSTSTPRGDRLEAPALRVSDDEQTDVQIIAPFSRHLGISRSALVLAQAIGDLPYSLRLCDFVRGHPNATSTMQLANLSGPGLARISIIHLNLEEIPDAIAYLPDVFTNSTLIAFPYLELSKLSGAQYLGLYLVDEIWSASDFITGTLKPHKRSVFTVGTALPSIHVCGKPSARQLAYREIAQPNEFVFLASGDALSGLHRKNLLGIIRCFVYAFSAKPDVRLVIKIHSTDRVASDHERHVLRVIREIASQSPRIVVN